MFRRDFLPSVWSLAIVPVITYLGAYWAWFRSESAYGRHMVDAAGGVIPAALKSLVAMTKEMLKTTAGHPHSDRSGRAAPVGVEAVRSGRCRPGPVLVYLSGGTAQPAAATGTPTA